MLKYLIIPVSIVMLALSSCSVDCKIDCPDPDGDPLFDISITKKDVDKDKCDDCDFAEVDQAELLGWDCDCEED